MPLWVNAANAVLVPSEREGFGLAVLEALACDVPVLATPVGITPEALEGIAGTLCAPFDAAAWRARSGRTWPTPTRGSRAARGPSATRPTRWPRGSSRPGASWWIARSAR